MASYLNGAPQYIPQIQPYQPDLNFLNNLLQTKQSAYDKNYDALSKRYGSLLNAPMMRQDNIQKRQEFFNVIDNDIKRISGMDLSLQQNVDAADTVFDSFLQNKDLVHDMSYTREYQNQLKAGESLKLCIDQEKCGGKYSDVALRALNYKAEEYKKASKEDAMNMSPGEFVPFINVQEKINKQLEKMLGKDGLGTFGVQQVVRSRDGKYNIKLTNGELLATPLKDMLLNQFSQDPGFKAMYDTESYVNRKDWIASNRQNYNNDDNLAEDAYFSLVDSQIQQARSEYQKAQDNKAGTDARKKVLEKQIRQSGSTGSDTIAEAFVAASYDDAAAQKALDHHDETIKVANSIFDAGDNRAMKRQRVDSFIAKNKMTNDITKASIYAANLTGRMDQEADPYKLHEVNSYLDFSLALKKQEHQYALMGEHEKLKSFLELKKTQMIQEYKKRGSAVGADNNPVVVQNWLGATTGETGVDEAGEMRSTKGQAAVGYVDNIKAFSAGYGQQMMDIITGSDDENEKKLAENTLINIYGKAQYDDKGKLLNAGYDPVSKSFVDTKGNKSKLANSVITDTNAGVLYKNALAEADKNKATLSHRTYLDKQGAMYKKTAQTNLDLYSASSKTFAENNKIVKNLGQFTDINDQSAWSSLFGSDNSLNNYIQFAKNYKASYANNNFGEMPSDDDVAEKWTEMNKEYNKIYSSSPKGLKALNGSSMFGMAGGGKTAGNAYMYTYNSNSPASEGTRGLIGIYEDALNGGLFTAGHQVTLEDAQNASSDNAKIALAQLITDFKSGNLTEDEKNAVAGQLFYSDIALTDPKFAGAYITLPETWLEKYRGKTKEEDDNTWADDSSLQKGVGVYFNKASAKNDLTTAFKSQPYDVILNHMSKTISDPNGGEITINKRNDDGSIGITGYLKSWDGQKYVVDPISQPYGSETSGQKLYEGIDYLINELSQKNKQAIENGTKTFDPNSLLKVKQTLNKISGKEQEIDLADAFYQSIQNY
jgi:hypothetical protein